MFKIKYITKGDILLIMFLILAGLGASFLLSFSKDQGQVARISVNGQEYGTYPLAVDQDFVIRQGDKYNHVVIKDGHVSIDKANCHGHDCVNQHSINQTNQVITCLPHKVIIEIKGGESEFDAVSN